MAFTDKNTLKELVDETTLIKDDITINRDNLKTNLENKGVDTTDLNKIRELIDKIDTIKTTLYNIDESKLNSVFEVKTTRTLPTARSHSTYYEKDNKITCFNGISSYTSGGAANWDYTKYTFDKATFVKIGQVAGNIPRDGYQIVYNKLKIDENIAIYCDVNYLKFLDILTNTVEKSSIPSPITNVSKTTDIKDNFIYVVGGRQNTTMGSSLVSKYDLITKTWTSQSDLCIEVTYGISIKVVDDIYIFHQNGTRRCVVKYDCIVQTSTILLDNNTISIPKIENAEVDYFIKNNKIYIAVLSGVYIYDIEKNIIEFVALTSFGSSRRLSNYFIFNNNNIFYKCGGAQEAASSSYDPLPVGNISQICTLN